MAGLLPADEIFEKAKDAAVGATNADDTSSVSCFACGTVHSGNRPG